MFAVYSEMSLHANENLLGKDQALKGCFQKTEQTQQKPRSSSRYEPYYRSDVML